MNFFRFLFVPRKLPARWVRFTTTHTYVADVAAIAVLAWMGITFSNIVMDSERSGHGTFVQTMSSITGSHYLTSKALELRRVMHTLFPDPVRNLFVHLYGNIALYMVTPLFLALEFLFPSNPRQPLISKGFLQDAVWYIFYTPIAMVILYPFVDLMHDFFVDHLGFLTVARAEGWPVISQVFAALLLTELFVWLNHFARHKVTTLWHFHAVHHSQKELNILTDDRGHIIDLLIGSLLMFVPFFIFDVSTLHAVAVITIYKPIHNRFIHANLRINLGWLGWVFTSPQFHRLHHSIEPEHADKNFGLYFTIFDHLFGTAYRNRNVYPATGIVDDNFPDEGKVNRSRLVWNWLSQVMYPFQQMKKSSGKDHGVDPKGWEHQTDSMNPGST